MNPNAKTRMDAIVKTRNLSRTFHLGGQPVQAIDGVDLDVAPGEFLVLKGKSGSGKSTLLSLIAGLDRPSSGRLEVSGMNLEALNAAQLAKFRQEKIGMIFQSFNLLPTLSVLENVALPALLADADFHGARRKAWDLLKLARLEHRAHHSPSEISGGEMQRTAIARALMNDPALIIADEPTGNLDSRTGATVLGFIENLNRNLGRTVIMATHSTDGDAMAHRILCLEDGRVMPAPCDA